MSDLEFQQTTQTFQPYEQQIKNLKVSHIPNYLEKKTLVRENFSNVKQELLND